jgi:hypothetical protein
MKKKGKKNTMPISFKKMKTKSEKKRHKSF